MTLNCRSLNQDGLFCCEFVSYIPTYLSIDLIIKTKYLFTFTFTLQSFLSDLEVMIVQTSDLLRHIGAALLYRGCQHQCSNRRYRRKKVDNLERLIASPTSSEVLAARSLKRSADDSSLSTMGRSKRSFASISGQKARTLFSADDMCLRGRI